MDSITVKIDPSFEAMMKAAVQTQFAHILGEHTQVIGAQLSKMLFETPPASYGSKPKPVYFTTILRAGMQDVVQRKVQEWIDAHEVEVSTLVDKIGVEFVGSDEFKAAVTRRICSVFQVDVKSKKAAPEYDTDDEED